MHNPAELRIPLNDGLTMPALGIGTALISNNLSQRVVEHSLEIGYRLIDTASYYGNEAAVGLAIRAMAVPRDECFLTTKAWKTELGYASTQSACLRSLERLNTEYIDLYLIHWPMPSLALYEDSWRALVDLRQQGIVRSIGVSNFNANHLQRIIEVSGLAPVINQIELHPWFRQSRLSSICRNNGILVQSWSPLALGRVLIEKDILLIATALNRTPAQVVLRWHLQSGRSVIPKASSPDRLAENIAVFDFHLSSEQMQIIDSLDRCHRLGEDPELG